MGKKVGKIDGRIKKILPISLLGTPKTPKSVNYQSITNYIPRTEDFDVDLYIVLLF